MDLRRIEYFVAVANTLHFGRAAKQIGIAQPALSQQIKLLEQELGGELLKRNKRSVSLTAAGNVFLAEADKLLALSDHAQKTAKRAFSGEVGELTIGFVESAMWEILPKVIKKHQEEYAGVKLILHQLNTQDQLKALQMGDISIGIIGLPIEKSEKWYTKQVRNEPIVAALAKDHHLSDSSILFPKDLSQEAFIMIDRKFGMHYHDTMLKICLGAGFHPSIIQEVDKFQTVLSLVSSNLGVSLIPESARYLRNDVLYKPLQGTENNTFPLSFIWRKEKHSPVVANFIQLIEDDY